MVATKVAVIVTIQEGMEAAVGTVAVAEAMEAVVVAAMEVN